jgi:hypothetical protein
MDVFSILKILPEPIAPKKSAITVKAPMLIPPKEAAIGIYF